MPQLTLMVHTIVSYTFAGVLLAFFLSFLLIKSGRFEDPMMRIRLMVMSLLLPLISYFAVSHFTTSYKLDIFWAEKIFWLLCQIGNWASFFTWPILAAAGSLVIFNLICVFRASKRHKRLPEANYYCGHDLEKLAAKLAAKMKMKKPIFRCWPGEDVKVFTTGYFKPTIVLSARLLLQLSQQEVEWVLAHEFAHIKRRDTVKLLAVELLKDIMFFMPLVHWISNVISYEMEKAADLLASKADPIAYAAVLLKVYRLQTKTGNAYGGKFQPAFDGGGLASRLETILDPPKPSRWWTGLMVMGAITVIVVYFLSWVC